MEKDHFPDNYNKNNRARGSDSNRRLPIVFNLDTTASMVFCDKDSNKSRLDHLNKAIRDLLIHLASSDETAPHVEVAFVVFTEDVVMVTDFEAPSKLTPAFFENARYFRCEGKKQIVDTVSDSYTIDGEKYPMTVPVFDAFPARTYTCIYSGVLRSVELIEERKKYLSCSGVNSFVPIMVTITDGNSSDLTRERQAQELVHSHCTSQGNASNLIIPLFIGVGDTVDENALKEYSRGYPAGLRIARTEDPSSVYGDMVLLIKKSASDALNLAEYDKKFPPAKNRAGEPFREKFWSHQRPPKRDYDLNQMFGKD